MANHITQTEDSVKVQYAYGEGLHRGQLVFEYSLQPSGDAVRVQLKVDEEIIYDREILAEEVFAYDFSPHTVACDSLLLNAGYIASLWNHRMLYLIYGDDARDKYYNAASAVCNVVSALRYSRKWYVGV